MLFKQKMQRSNGFKDFERKFSKISRRKTSKTLKISKTQTIQEGNIHRRKGFSVKKTRDQRRNAF